MIDILDILIKIATSIEDDYMGDVWFKLMRIDDNFANYARSNEGRRVFLDYATEIVADDYWKRYFLFGRIHRNHIDDLPAAVKMNTRLCDIYYYNGRIHRNNDKPAIMHANGSVEWYKHGKRHRENNMYAVLSYDDNKKEWWYDGRHIRSEQI
jgi:hypothetical protein